MKKLISTTSCVAFAIAFGLNFATESNDWEREMVEENIEALAGVPEGETCYKTVTTQEGSKILYCSSCIWLDNSTYSWVSGTSTCQPAE